MKRTLAVVAILMFAAIVLTGCSRDEAHALTIAMPDGWELVEGRPNYVMVDSVYYDFVGRSVSIECETETVTMRISVAATGPDGATPVATVGDIWSLEFTGAWQIIVNATVECGTYEAFASEQPTVVR